MGSGNSLERKDDCEKQSLLQHCTGVSTTIVGVIRIGLVGDRGVGKTAIAMRAMKQRFPSRHTPTNSKIMHEFDVPYNSIVNMYIRVELVEMPGRDPNPGEKSPNSSDESYQKNVSTELKHLDALIIVCDETKPESVNSMKIHEEWLQIDNQNYVFPEAGNRIPIYALLNKTEMRYKDVSLSDDDSLFFVVPEEHNDNYFHYHNILKRAHKCHIDFHKNLFRVSAKLFEGRSVIQALSAIAIRSYYRRLKAKRVNAAVLASAHYGCTPSTSGETGDVDAEEIELDLETIIWNDSG